MDIKVIFKSTSLRIVYKTISTCLLYLFIICIYYNHLILIYLLHLNNNTPSRYIQSINLVYNIFFIQNRLSYFLIHKKNQLSKTILKVINKEQIYRRLYLYKSLEIFHIKQLWMWSSRKPLIKILYWIYYCCIVHLQRLSIFLNLIKSLIKYYIRILRLFRRWDIMRNI